MERWGTHTLQQIKGLEGLISKEKLKELNLSSLTRHQPGAGIGVGGAPCASTGAQGMCTPSGAAFQGVISRSEGIRGRLAV